MARNRMIKADFWADEKVGKLSDKAKLLFIGSWVFADDSGVCRANDVYLRNNIFPYDENITLQQIKEVLQELINNGVVVVSEYSDELYLYIVNFKKHQVINKPSAFRYIAEDYGHVFSSSVVVVEEQSRPKVKEKVKENIIGIFQKPSLEEVKQYCIERKNNINPETFINHYECNGWMVGKSKMKDWQAAIRKWEGNAKQFSNTTNKDLTCLTGVDFISKYEQYSKE